MRKYFDSVLTLTGEGVNGAVVTLTDQSGAAVQLYSDNGVTPLSSCVTDSYGYFEFYVANGRYTITITYDGNVVKTIEDVLIVDSYGPAWSANGQLQVESSGSNAAPNLASQNDTDTGLRWSGNNNLRFVTGGAEAMRINSSGTLVIGATVAVTDSYIGQPALQVNALDQTASVLVSSWSTDTSAGAKLSLNHSRSGAPNTYTPTQVSEQVGSIAFRGVDSAGNAFAYGGLIHVRCTGAPGVGYVPVGMRFNVYDNNGGGADMITIENDQVRIGSGALTSDSMPELTGDLDRDTGIRWRGSDQLAFVTGGAERARFVAGAQFVINHTSAIAAAGVTPILQAHGSSAANGTIGAFNWQSTVSGAGTLSLNHARGGAIGSHTILNANDALGAITFNGSNGSVFKTGARIVGYAAGFSGSELQGQLDMEINDAISATSRVIMSLNNNSVLVGSFGALTSPNIAAVADTNTGLWWSAADQLSFVLGANDRFTMTSDGRFYGNALHNNAGSMTGTTNQYIGSGTYTPTLTNVTNLAASSASSTHWIRVGNVVHVSGVLSIDPTAAGAIELGISLPIASTFGAQFRLGGTAAPFGASTESFGIRADTTNNRAQLMGNAVDTTNHNLGFSFSYLII